MTFDDPQAWLTAFRDAPAARLEALIGGWDQVAPYFRLDGADVLLRVLPRGATPEAAADRALVDRALTAWFVARLAAPVPGSAEWNGAALDAAQALGVVCVLPVPETAGLLAARLGEALAWAGGLTRPTSLDLRGEVWRGLARHQTDRRLAARWLEMCAQVGRGELAEHYLQIALTGLQAMPGAEAGTQEVPADDMFAGLLAWGRRLANSGAGKARFVAEWRALVALYPRGPGYWQKRLAPVLGDEPCRYLAGWWAEEIGLRSGQAAVAPMRVAPTATLRENHATADRILNATSVEAERLFGRFLRDFEEFTEWSGDTYNLTRSFNVVGNRLLSRYPTWALRLARAAIACDRTDQHSWLLWSHALRRLGHLDLAETVLWEATRAFPQNDVAPHALAELLAQAGRTAEAEALFRRAMRQFPDNELHPNALAHVLASAGRVAEAETLYRATMLRSANNDMSRNGLAHLLAGTGRVAEAETLYRATMQRSPRNAVCRLDLGLLLLDQRRMAEVAPILEELRGLKGTEAHTLGEHLQAVQEGRARPLGGWRGDAIEAVTDGAEAAEASGWDELRNSAVATRAGFLLSPALADKRLALVTAAERARLRTEAHMALDGLLARYPNHPVVRLLAWRYRRGGAAAAPTAAVDDGAGDYALRLAMLTEPGATAGDFAALLRDGRYAELRPVTSLGWLLADETDAEPAAAVMLRWLPEELDRQVEPVLRDLHERLGRLVSVRTLRRMTANEFLDKWSEEWVQAAAELRMVLDLALLSLVEREVPYAALAWEPERVAA